MQADYADTMQTLRCSIATKPGRCLQSREVRTSKAASRQQTQSCKDFLFFMHMGLSIPSLTTFYTDHCHLFCHNDSHVEAQTKLLTYLARS